MRTIGLFLLTALFFTFSSCHKEIPQIKYYPNGNVEEECHLRNGKLSGGYKAYYETGTISGEGQFRKGLPVGTWFWYYTGGEIMTIEKHNRKGKIIGLDGWDEKGNQVVSNGTGTFIRLYPDGTVKSKAGFKDCMFDGANEAWYPNGVKEYEFFYKDGKPVGTWRFWNMDGTLNKTESY